MENHGWTRCRDQLPEPGQIVYYFGPYIGIGIGRFDPTVETKGWTENENGEEVLVDLPERVINSINHDKFINNRFGVVDTDDAPFWREYNEEHAKGWCPIPPDYITLEERLEQDAQT
jgi:hypothetical protein